ncbi:MAG: carbamoyl phosphate synthase large subunit, partial [Myxococcales bacterium]|nr:carbamoyl phosphate synthase large subunit [Myxococcales bacterium]
ALGVVGLMNVQFAVRLVDAPEIYVLEVNPRASRTVPFVSKAIGRPLAKLGALVMAGAKLAELDFTAPIIPPYLSVKEAVFPFTKFAGVDPLLGPEMKSTGEVMGIADDFPTAFLKSQEAASQRLPTEGCVLVTSADEDKAEFVALARRLVDLGFSLMATRGTGAALTAAGMTWAPINKEYEDGDTTVRAILDGRVQLVLCTTKSPALISQSRKMRRAALQRGIPYSTTLVGAAATAAAIERLRAGDVPVRALQDHHARLTP